MNRKTTGLVCAGAACLVFFVSGFTVPAAQNPPGDPTHSIEVALQPPQSAARVLNKACMDCHSYETRWPWYARIVPASFLISRDVERGRNALNFSEWTAQAGRKPGTALGALMASCVAVQTGHMPPRQYRMLHQEARLTRDEKDAFCRWTTDSATHYRKCSTVAHAVTSTP